MSISVTDYGKWQPITAPGGQVYYKVPGTGLVYDPTLSQAKGRSVFWQNPEPTVAAQNQALQAQQDAIKADKEAKSPLNQAIIPTATTIGAGLAGKYLTNKLFGPATPEIVPQATATVPAAASLPAPSAPQVLGAVHTPTDSFLTGATGASGGEVGSLPGGGGGQILSAAATPTAQGGFLSGLAPAGSDFAGFGTLGQASLGIGGALGAYNLISNFGHQSLLGGASSGASTGALIGSFAGPGGTLIGTGIGALAGGLSSLFKHETTAQAEEKKWSGLQKEGNQLADVAYQANHPQGDTGVWQTGPFAGKQWNFEDAKTLAKQDPSQFRLVYGNLKTFGNDWGNYSDSQKDQITSKLLDAGLYKGHKGDIVVSDMDKARSIANDVVNPSKATEMGKQLAERFNGRLVKSV